jgi:hypothetical protein
MLCQVYESPLPPRLAARAQYSTPVRLVEVRAGMHTSYIGLMLVACQGDVVIPRHACDHRAPPGVCAESSAAGANEEVRWSVYATMECNACDDRATTRSGSVDNEDDTFDDEYFYSDVEAVVHRVNDNTDASHASHALPAGFVGTPPRAHGACACAHVCWIVHRHATSRARVVAGDTVRLGEAAVPAATHRTGGVCACVVIT